MENRIGWGAAGIAFVSGAILALFQVQEWHMVTWVALVLFITLLITGAIFVLIFVHGIWESFLGRARLYGLQWPVYRRDRPNPHQVLLDIAAHDANNPQSFLHVLDRRVANKDLRNTIEMPWVELKFELFNCNVHPVVVGAASGRAKYRGEELPAQIEGGEGNTNMPRGTRYHYIVRQYLPPPKAAQLFQEMEEEVAACGAQRRAQVRSLDLSAIRISLECNGNSFKLQLTDSTTFWFE